MHRICYVHACMEVYPYILVCKCICSSHSVPKYWCWIWGYTITYIPESVWRGWVSPCPVLLPEHGLTVWSAIIRIAYILCKRAWKYNREHRDPSLPNQNHRAALKEVLPLMAYPIIFHATILIALADECIHLEQINNCLDSHWSMPLLLQAGAGLQQWLYWYTCMYWESIR